MTAPRPCRAVLDVGKTHARLCVVDGAGQPLETLRRRSEVGPGPPYPHLDTDSLFDWVLDGLASLCTRHDIGSIVPVAHGATAALLAGDELALPVVDYEQEIPAGASAAYDRQARDFAHTGSPRLPLGLNLGRQLFWQRQAFPLEVARATDLLLHPQYWAYRLSGAKVAEVTSLGCHTDLWEPAAGAPSSFARSAGWADLLPPVVPAWATVGAPSADVRSRTGLAADCCVLAGIHDSNASFLAHRAPRTDDFCVVSTGTWVVCMAHGAEWARLGEERDMLANVDAFGGPVPSARFMGGREYAAIAGDGAAGAPAAADLERVLRRGALALPAFASGGGPFAGRRGRSIDADDLDASGRAALAALYCALVTDTCLDLLGARGDIVVEGRFAANEAYVAALAGLRPDRSVSVSRDETGTVAGAVALCDLAAGRLPSSPPLVAVSPWDPASLDRYRARWRERVGSTADA